MRTKATRRHRDTLTVTDRAITSPVSTQIAQCVGQECWVVSFLPGRTLTAPQAEAAMRFAEAVEGVLSAHAAALGMTPAELVGYLAMQQVSGR